VLQLAVWLGAVYLCHALVIRLFWGTEAYAQVSVLMCPKPEACNRLNTLKQAAIRNTQMLETVQKDFGFISGALSHLL
jgi:hypothetical protein